MSKHLLEEHILKLEKSLLQPEVRQSAEQISELLLDYFTEFCSSGRVYEYKREMEDAFSSRDIYR